MRVDVRIRLWKTIFAMVFARHQLRLLKLEGRFDPASWRIALQGSPLLIFLLCLGIGAVAVTYMLRLFFRPQQTSAR